MDNISEKKIENAKPLGARLGEAGFCICYLVFVLIVAIFMHNKEVSLFAESGPSPDYYRYGFGFLMAALLGGGDAFHLIPRICGKNRLFSEQAT